MKQKFLGFSLILLVIFQLSIAGNAQQFFKQHPQINPYQYTVVKEQSFQKAAVTSAHPLASMVGAAIMKDGGNAYDAAIAVQFTLAVVFPSAGNIGGGGFLLSRNKEGVLMGIDFREAAPSKAHRDMYLDENGIPIEGMSRLGVSASGIPGSVAGMFSTLPFAKMTMKQLLQPAYELAAGGFVITESEARSLNAERKNFINQSAQASAFTRKENWKAGDTLYQPELAATILRIQQKGKAGFYEGETAELIVKEMKNSKGVISLEDLKKYNPKFRKPIEFDYRGHHIISFAPPSSGGILIAQMLQMIAPYPVSVMGANTFESVSLMVEAQRRAYADRAEHMGDPDYWKVPTTTLTSNAYAQERMKDYQAGVPGNSKMIQAGITKESEQTTHFSVVDEAGNMVSVTTTLNGSYGNKTIVGGAGFLLNNEMDDFSIKPGVPNMYGALGGEANAIQPGKRMLSSMTPTLVTKNNQPYITIGTPGGTTIPNQVYEGLVNIIDHQMSIKAAIDAPRFHHQHIPDNLTVEADFPEKTINALKEKGYTVNKRGAFGRMDGIMILPNGNRVAAGDKRGDDSVAGY
ncbi:MAG: gamma-glutamyltransferase [Sediminibacterium sp.]